MPKTGVSAPPSTLGGATTGFRMSTLMLRGNYLLKENTALNILVVGIPGGL